MLSTTQGAYQTAALRGAELKMAAELKDRISTATWQVLKSHCRHSKEKTLPAVQTRGKGPSAYLLPILQTRGGERPDLEAKADPSIVDQAEIPARMPAI